MAEIVRWGNKDGYTLMLTNDEKDELLTLLKTIWGKPFRPVESKHFTIENDDFEDES